MVALRRASALCYSVLLLFSYASDDFLSKEQEGTLGLSAELESFLGQSIASQFDKLKAKIHPMFLSLPKRSGNQLSPATARYALHRFSMDYHGWSINGIQPTKDSFDATHLTVPDILRGLLPEHILGIFGKHIMQHDGISLDEVTIMAATIEHFVHEDQKGILRTVSEAMDLPTVGPMRDDDMRNIIKTYLTIFLSYVTYDDVKSRKSFKWFFAETKSMYPGWADSALLVDDETDTLLHLERDITNPFRAHESSMDEALRVVEQVAGHYSSQHWELECKQIKDDLIEYDYTNTGRIRLVDFYRAGLTSKYFYVETKDYLRAVGALDDTDPIWGPKVIIPNIVQAESNCLASGHIYSVCCMDECEGLFGYLEQQIAAPEASPEQIISAVSVLSSSTIHAPRNLSTPLVSRLHEIATAHGGSVIVHSRLFAQWMHQAFPNECKYPHLAGTITEIPADDWEKLTGLSSRIDTNGPKKRRADTLRAIEELEDQVRINNETFSPMAEEGFADDMWSSDDESLIEPQASLFMSLIRSWAFLTCSLFVGVGATLYQSNKRMVSGKEQPADYDQRSFTV